MSINYSKHFNTKSTPQNQKVPGTNQVKNSAGGYTFQVSDLQKLDRFLILGSEGGSYYASESKLTVENADNIVKLVETCGKVVVDRIVEVSDSGRAPKNDPALFALAIAAKMGDVETRRYAMSKLSKVARTGTHLFTFAQNIKSLGGWGRATKRGISNWYTEKDNKKLEYQLVKYQSRNGWSHKDLLRLAHVKTDDAEKNNMFLWAGAKYNQDSFECFKDGSLIYAFEQAKNTSDSKEIVKLISDYNLPRECVPTSFLNDVEVWEALLEKMPMTAMIRNLAKMTNVGLLAPLSESVVKIKGRLLDQEYLRKSRVHPITLLNALNTYAAGRGVRGSLTWEPNTHIIDALNDAFYLSFGNVTPTNKAQVLALDVSGSMTWNNIAGCPGINPAVGAAAMALVTANVESNYEIVAFSGNMVPIDISPKDRLDTVFKKMYAISMGRTDCSLPMQWAQANNIKADAFSIYTDNETWYGQIHPFQALQNYRKALNPEAKLIVLGMLSNGFSIANPNDPGMLDVVGFDTATPQLMSEFILGNI
jgi:60 kDa SS-A/Ro ribonucleoprotein